jgi:hypothetical protein
MDGLAVSSAGERSIASEPKYRIPQLELEPKRRTYDGFNVADWNNDPLARVTFSLGQLLKEAWGS